MSTGRNLLTEEGLKKLQAELDQLIATRRPAAAERVEAARELGNTEDNEYEDAKNEQAFVEGRIIEVEDILKNAEMIPSNAQPSETIRIGSKVTIMMENDRQSQYKIVGRAEVDAKEGLISNESPVGRALLGHIEGDVVEVVAPAGVRKISVVKVE